MSNKDLLVCVRLIDFFGGDPGASFAILLLLKLPLPKKPIHITNEEEEEEDLLFVAPDKIDFVSNSKNRTK